MLTGIAGEIVEYEIKVTNIGNVALKLPGFEDEKCDPGTIAGGPGAEALGVGSTTTYTCTRGFQGPGLYQNVADRSVPGEAPLPPLESNDVMVLAVEPIPHTLGPSPGTPGGGNRPRTGRSASPVRILAAGAARGDGPQARRLHRRRRLAGDQADHVLPRRPQAQDVYAVTGEAPAVHARDRSAQALLRRPQGVGEHGHEQSRLREGRARKRIRARAHRTRRAEVHRLTRSDDFDRRAHADERPQATYVGVAQPHAPVRGPTRYELRFVGAVDAHHAPSRPLAERGRVGARAERVGAVEEASDRGQLLGDVEQACRCRVGRASHAHGGTPDHPPRAVQRRAEALPVDPQVLVRHVHFAERARRHPSAAPVGTPRELHEDPHGAVAGARAQREVDLRLPVAGQEAQATDHGRGGRGTPVRGRRLLRIRPVRERLQVGERRDLRAGARRELRCSGAPCGREQESDPPERASRAGHGKAARGFHCSVFHIIPPCERRPMLIVATFPSGCRSARLDADGDGL